VYNQKIGKSATRRPPPQTKNARLRGTVFVIVDLVRESWNSLIAEFQRGYEILQSIEKEPLILVQ
jgi:hypothetical protein